MKEDVLLCKCVKGHTESAVRELTACGHIAYKYYNLKSNDEPKMKKPSVFVGIDNGYYCTVSGFGPMVDSFIKTGQLADYNGENVFLKFPGDDHYRKALLRYTPFDQCFNFVNTDVDQSEENCHPILLNFWGMCRCWDYFVLFYYL